MFGLTKREQRWAAEQKAAELLTNLTIELLKQETARSQQKHDAKLAALTAENQLLKRQLEETKVIQKDTNL